MHPGSGRLVIGFSSIGHLLVHFFTAFYFTVVLTLEEVWRIPYADLLDMWLLAAALTGLCAMPAGWLGDRWSLPGMIAVFFVGLGAMACLGGLVGGPHSMPWLLAGIGLFAAIYHPVAIPWLIRTAGARAGRALAINGISGALGIGLASLVSGAIIDLLGWRWTFLLPGLLCLGCGLAMGGLLWRGAMPLAPAGQARPAGQTKPDRDAAMRGVAILMLAMFLSGLTFHVTQTSMPKLFDLRLDDWTGGSATRVGLLVSIVYGAAASGQFIGGWLADRWPLKTAWLATWLVQFPMLLTAALAGGPVLVLALLLAVSFNNASLPAENMMLARFTPGHRHGLVFGAKYVLAFGAAPLGLKLVGWFQNWTGGFVQLFLFLTAISLVVIGLACLLPGRRHGPEPVASPRPAG